MDNKDFQYVYFIENHLQSKPATIDFSNKEIYFDELEIAEQKLYEYDENYAYIIYKFKLFNSRIKNNKKNVEIVIKLKDKAENIFESRIFINDFSRDIFIYGFTFDITKVLSNVIEPPIFIPFNQVEEFEIYINYIRNVLKKKQDSKENEDFIFSSQKLLAGRDKKFNFSFYLMVLLESCTTKYVKRHLKFFKPDKIEEIGIIKETKLNQIKNLINLRLPLY